VTIDPAEQDRAQRVGEGITRIRWTHTTLPHPRQRIPLNFCFNTRGGWDTDATAQPVLRLEASRQQSLRQLMH
jgi:hypothetical protein